MHTRPAAPRVLLVLLVLLALVAVLAGVALVRRPRELDPLSTGTLGALLEEALEAPPGAAAPETLPETVTPAWRALLDAFAEPADAGLVLRLGWVLADPTAARASAESAGELLALEAEGPEGKLGLPLWRAILADPAVGPEHVLTLYGCRHSALPAAGPVIEDSYFARLSLARALRALAKAESVPLELRGEEAPASHGVNFEVQLAGGVQSVKVTFDAHPGTSLRASRPLAPSAPNDARARANLAEALRAHAAAAGRGPLTFEGLDAPVPGGVDFRLEVLGERLSLVARRGSTRLATHRVLEGLARQP